MAWTNTSWSPLSPAWFPEKSPRSGPACASSFQCPHLFIQFCLLTHSPTSKHPLSLTKSPRSGLACSPPPAYHFVCSSLTHPSTCSITISVCHHPIFCGQCMPLEVCSLHICVLCNSILPSNTGNSCTLPAVKTWKKVHPLEVLIICSCCFVAHKSIVTHWRMGSHEYDWLVGVQAVAYGMCRKK